MVSGIVGYRTALWQQGCVGGDISHCSQSDISIRHSLTVTGKVIEARTPPWEALPGAPVFTHSVQHSFCKSLSGSSPTRTHGGDASNLWDPFNLRLSGQLSPLPPCPVGLIHLKPITPCGLFTLWEAIPSQPMGRRGSEASG